MSLAMHFIIVNKLRKITVRCKRQRVMEVQSHLNKIVREGSEETRSFEHTSEGRTGQGIQCLNGRGMIQAEGRAAAES